MEAQMVYKGKTKPPQVHLRGVDQAWLLGVLAEARDRLEARLAEVPNPSNMVEVDDCTRWQWLLAGARDLQTFVQEEGRRGGEKARIHDRR